MLIKQEMPYFIGQKNKDPYILLQELDLEMTTKKELLQDQNQKDSYSQQTLRT